MMDEQDGVWLRLTVPARVPVTLVISPPAGDPHPRAEVRQVQHWTFRTTAYKQHAKLYVLEFSRFVRVVITSANLSRFDWACMNQCVWFQDFPLRPVSSPSSTASLTRQSPPSTASPSAQVPTSQLPVFDFGRDLVEFLTQLDLAELVARLAHVDFSSARVLFIASVPSALCTTPSEQRFGHARLRQLTQRHTTLCASQQQERFLLTSSSSLGSLSARFMGAFLESAAGVSARGQKPCHAQRKPTANTRSYKSKNKRKRSDDSLVASSSTSSGDCVPATSSSTAENPLRFGVCFPSIQRMSEIRRHSALRGLPDLSEWVFLLHKFW
jgi:Tyrosyl-DNA phosphodiesterase